MDKRGRYRVYALCFDMQGKSEGDFDDFRRNLDKLEADFPGTHLLGNDETLSWPEYVISESVPTT